MEGFEGHSEEEQVLGQSDVELSEITMEIYARTRMALFNIGMNIFRPF